MSCFLIKENIDKFINRIGKLAIIDSLLFGQLSYQLKPPPPPQSLLKFGLTGRFRRTRKQKQKNPWLRDFLFIEIMI
jgi:hypothetical protein